MKHEREFKPWREEEPYDEPYPAWIQLSFWIGALVFCGGCYVGLFYLLLWVFP